jgi:hypothetical protein
MVVRSLTKAVRGRKVSKIQVRRAYFPAHIQARGVGARVCATTNLANVFGSVASTKGDY